MVFSEKHDALAVRVRFWPIAPLRQASVLLRNLPSIVDFDALLASSALELRVAER